MRAWAGADREEEGQCVLCVRFPLGFCGKAWPARCGVVLGKGKSLEHSPRAPVPYWSRVPRGPLHFENVPELDLSGLPRLRRKP